MRKNRRALAGAVCFLLIFFLLFGTVTSVFQKKWVEQGGLGDTYIAEAFHNLKKNSIELAFMGNSQIIRGVSSMHLLDQYGISAFSTATGSQPALCTYYYAKQLVKKQHLKAVVIDVSSLYETIRKTTVRRVTDTAPFSIDKYEMIMNYMKFVYYLHGPKESMRHLWTILLPLVQYHERWQELSADDFVYRSYEPFVFRGNTSRLVTKPAKNILIDDASEEEDIDIKYNQIRYLNKTIELFQKNDIPVVLIKTPKEGWSKTRMQQVQEVADRYGLEYLDFNSRELFEAAGLDLERDFADSEHLNLDGAIKLTDYLAAFLQERVSFQQAELTRQDQEDLADYREVLERWNAMPEEERLQAGKKAEPAEQDMDSEEESREDDAQ